MEAYLRLACAHAEKGTLDAAIENMKKVLSVEPDRLEAHVYLGCFYAKKWMLDEAVKELCEAKQLRDRIIEKLVTEAERFIRDCMFDKAVSVAREVIKIDSRNKKARWLLAMAYGKKGRWMKRLKYAKKSLVCIRMIFMLTRYWDGFMHNEICLKKQCIWQNRQFG